MKVLPNAIRAGGILTGLAMIAAAICALCSYATGGPFVFWLLLLAILAVLRFWLHRLEQKQRTGPGPAPPPEESRR
jgi:hypothetical protein